ncbi:MAG: helix-turn-helix transcriptional regulator [Gallionella sp.]|jgi:DNA-binding XRE family transcriptional regulator
MKKKQTARLASVVVEDGMNLSVTYTDGRIVRVNLCDVANRLQAFAPLEAPQEFATAQITDFGWSLEWNCGASLDSDRVLELAMEQAGMAENVRFRQWQDAHHLSLAEAAKAIGLTRRTISKYRTGSSPVPRYIALACKGWEAEQQGK